MGKINFRRNRKPNSDILGRFWEKVDKRSPDECWVWLAAKDKYGYGVLNINGIIKRAHRISYEINVSPIPVTDGYQGTEVCQRCNNPSCVNPSHLYLADHQTNLQDAGRDGLMGAHTPRRGEQHHQKKLTEDGVRFIRANCSYMTFKELGEHLGVSCRTVSDVLAGRTWTHVL